MNLSMSDLIDREQALKALEETKPTVWTESDYELGQKNQWSLDILAIECLPSAEPLTEEDYIELRDRFGEYVEFIVRDMITGKGERWKT